ncbi:MAG: hypothetical protein R3E93_02765 [Thiothrix sp.]
MRVIARFAVELAQRLPRAALEIRAAGRNGRSKACRVPAEIFLQTTSFARWWLPPSLMLPSAANSRPVAGKRQRQHSAFVRSNRTVKADNDSQISNVAFMCFALQLFVRENTV